MGGHLRGSEYEDIGLASGGIISETNRRVREEKRTRGTEKRWRYWLMN